MNNHCAATPDKQKRQCIQLCIGFMVQLPSRATRNIDKLGMCRQSVVFWQMVHCVSYSVSNIRHATGTLAMKHCIFKYRCVEIAQTEQMSENRDVQKPAYGLLQQPALTGL